MGSMTVDALLREGARLLTEVGHERGRLEADLIMSHLLKTPRAHLYLRLGESVPPKKAKVFCSFIEKRRTGVPLSYILKTQEFMGLSFEVNPKVLIPRPETELIVEEALGFLKKREDPWVIDMGTGSGAVAVSLAVFCSKVKVAAVDLSQSALGVARENARRHKVSGRVFFYEGDLFEPLLSSEQTYDGIVSNPPYIPSATISSLDRGVKDFEPRLALDGGEDGLCFYRRMAAYLPILLKKDGFLVWETGHDQTLRVKKIVEETNLFSKISVKEDYAGQLRIIIAS